MPDEIIDQNILDEQQDFSYEKRFQELLNNGYSVDLGLTISRAWSVLNKDIGSFIGFTVILFVINFVLGYLSTVAGESSILGVAAEIASWVINTPLLLGYSIVASKIINKEEYSFNDFFKGFNKVTQLFLGNLLSIIFMIIGFFLLIIPGIYLTVVYAWVSIIIFFAGYEFWGAMEVSRKLITKKWFSFLWFFIVFTFINLGGLLVCGVGLLITVPLTSIALYVLFHDLVHEENGSTTLINNEDEFSS